MRRSVCLLAIALLSIALLSIVAGCASAPPTWATRTALPRDAQGDPLLLDCDAPDEGLVCAMEPQEREPTCLALLERPTAELGAHRCLAHLAIERTRSLTIVTKEAVTKEAVAKEAVTSEPQDNAMALIEMELERTMRTAPLLAIAHMHLQEALELAPREPGLYVHMLAVDQMADDREAMASDASHLAMLLAEPDVEARVEDVQHVHQSAFQLLELGDAELAELVFAELAFRHPTYVPGRIDLSTVLVSRGANDDAARTMQELLDDDAAGEVTLSLDERDQLWIVLADVHLKRSALDEARGALTRAAGRGPFFLLTKAKVDLASGAIEEARAALEAVLSDPDARALHLEAKRLLASVGSL